MYLEALCDLMDDLSRRTWDTLTEAARLKVPRGEVTITETLLFHLAQQSRTANFRLGIGTLNQNEEAERGADFDLWLGLRDGNYLGYSFQAKRARATDIPDYESVDRFVGKSDVRQYNRLIGYALDHDMAPLHLFYNGAFCARAGFRQPPGAQLYGCAVMPTQLVQDLFENGADLPDTRLRRVERYAPHSAPWSSIFRYPNGGTGGISSDATPPGLGDPLDTEVLLDGVPSDERWPSPQPQSLPSYVREAMTGTVIVDADMPRYVVVIDE